MDKIKKIKFQEDCSFNILELIPKAYNYYKDFKINSFDKPIILEGPTGMGKTAIAKNLIEKIPNQLPLNKVHFIFLSLGQGGLNDQTEIKLKKWLDAGSKFVDLDSRIDDFFPQNSISIINWEKIHSIGRGGKRTNKLLVENEYGVSLKTMFEKSRKKGIETVLLIDESHLRSQTEVAFLIKESIIKPIITIEISATPILNKTSEFHIKVEEDVVVEAGLIKKSHFLNVIDIKENEELSLEKLLELSTDKLEEIEEGYKKVKTKITPLKGTQLPNGDEGDLYLSKIEKFYYERGYTYENGKLACWLDGKKKNLEDIEKNDGNQRVLIFKQAIAQGWDCPRAIVWLKLRDSNNTTFNRQTCGRFGRTPEHKHYGVELLDNVHIFTNDSKYTVPIDQKKNFINYYPEELSIAKFSLNIPSVGLKRVGFNDLTEDSFKYFDKEFNKKFNNKLKAGDFKFNLLIMSTVIDFKSNKVAGKTFLNEKIDVKDLNQIAHRLSSTSGASIHLEDDLLVYEFQKTMEPSLQGLSIVRSLDRLESVFVELLNTYFKKGITFKEMYIIVSNNKCFFNDLVISVREKGFIKPTKFEIENFDWNVPETLRFNKVTHIKNNSEFSKKYPFRGCYIQSKSSHEDVFLETLNNSRILKNIKILFKNGEGNKHFLGICSYLDPKDNQTERIFYIDWVIETINGSILVLEIKGKADENYMQTKAKAEALQLKLKQLREKGLKIFGGVVFRHEGEWYVDDCEVFDVNHINLSKLSTLENFLLDKQGVNDNVKAN